jgi:hypothetical protein
MTREEAKSITACPLCGGTVIWWKGNGEWADGFTDADPRVALKCIDSNCRWKTDWLGKGEKKRPNRPSGSFLHYVSDIRECQWCGISRAYTKIEFHAHHIKPLDEGGNEYGPFLCLCHSCHEAAHLARRARERLGFKTVLVDDHLNKEPF